MTIDTDFPRQGNVPAQMAGSADLDRYWPHVAHLDVSDDRKRELLDAAWRIMGSFVDRAFGEDPAQCARIVGDRRDSARDPAARNTIGSAHTSHTMHDGDLAGVFRRCGEGD